MSELTVVLVEPRTPANIGMVCRAMANFGVTHLRLVNPCDHLDPMAKRLAVDAAPLLERAEIFESLTAAIADQHMSVATTRRSGRYRGELVELRALAEQQQSRPADTRIALVFGREDSGLTLEEVGTCQHAACIETTGELGSLNLAQAVLLFLYELTRTPSAPPPGQKNLPTLADTEQLFSEVDSLLDRIAYLNPQRPDAVMRPLRSLLTRAAPDIDELNLLRGIVKQLDDSVQNWPGKRRGSPDS